jgi:hypothetical protein
VVVSISEKVGRTSDLLLRLIYEVEGAAGSSQTQRHLLPFNVMSVLPDCFIQRKTAFKLF